MLKEVLKITNNKDTETLDQLRQTDKPFFIYGAGVMARWIYEHFLRRGITNARVVVDDKKTAAIDPVFSHLEILESRELDALYQDYIIIIGFYSGLYNVDKYAGQFKNASEIKSYISCMDSLEEMSPAYFREHYDEFESVYRMLADDESRSYMSAYLKAKISSDHRYLLPCQSPGVPYFSKDFLKLTDRESYVDCGAYDGNSIRDFVETAGGYRHIWAFEPDHVSFKLTSALVAERGLPNVTLVEAGAYSEKVRLPFVMSHDLGSRIEEGAGAFVDCDTIDNVTEGREVTFIKMDIEGSELAALKGGQTAIKKYRPNLAICAYHRADDFFTLAPFIRQLVPEYKLYVRLDSLFAADVVLFATVR